MATADSGRSPKHVAPFGGREPRLGTNPISIAVPSDLEAPLFYRHGDLGGGGRQDRACDGARRGDPARMDHRLPTGGRPPIRSSTARAARCCRSAAPRATRAAAWPRWSRYCADCSRASASASSRRGGTMTAASWRCSRSRRSGRSRVQEGGRRVRAITSRRRRPPKARRSVLSGRDRAPPRA